VSEEEIMSEIAYDLRLEKRLDEVKMQIWLNEELQLQPENLRNSLIEKFNQLNS